MKSKYNQLHFINTKLLPIYGIKSISDYDTYINIKTLTEYKKILKLLNEQLNELRKVFPIKSFNLHKSEYKIKSIEQAFSILKKCLVIAHVPFEIKKIKTENYVRLIPQNILLSEYIKMSSGRTDQKCDQKEITENPIEKSNEKNNEIIVDGGFSIGKKIEVKPSNEIIVNGGLSIEKKIEVKPTDENTCLVLSGGIGIAKDFSVKQITTTDIEKNVINTETHKYQFELSTYNYWLCVDDENEDYAHFDIELNTFFKMCSRNITELSFKCFTHKNMEIKSRFCINDTPVTLETTNNKIITNTLFPLSLSPSAKCKLTVKINPDDIKNVEKRALFELCITTIMLKPSYYTKLESSKIIVESEHDVLTKNVVIHDGILSCTPLSNIDENFKNTPITFKKNTIELTDSKKNITCKTMNIGYISKENSIKLKNYDAYTQSFSDLCIRKSLKTLHNYYYESLDDGYVKLHIVLNDCVKYVDCIGDFQFSSNISINHYVAEINYYTEMFVDHSKYITEANDVFNISSNTLNKLNTNFEFIIEFKPRLIEYLNTFTFDLTASCYYMPNIRHILQNSEKIINVKPAE